jgi:pimeloyl-ACP methyl ester carboxylesterase
LLIMGRSGRTVVLALAVALTCLLAPSAALADYPGEPSPSGANDWACRPTAAHPNPVVLVHGLGANMYGNWSYVSPQLKSAGYCVFALTYGRDPRYGPYSFGGVVRMEESSHELADFIARVRTTTGASKVDIVGHSEGTVMPRWYMERLGGAPNVDKFVALTPLWRGSTVNGLGSQAAWTKPYCGSCSEFVTGSDYLNDVNSDGEGIPGVRITSLITRNDELVTPYTSGINSDPSATNIILQDVCAADPSEHGAMAFDPIVVHLIKNALDPANASPASCTG